MLKCWKDIPGYHVFVSDKWKALQVDGWGGFVLKEKLKLTNAALKDWHMTHAQPSLFFLYPRNSQFSNFFFLFEIHSSFLFWKDFV
jgi:hypothetical protein